MNLHKLNVGFIPLVDAAPLIAASEMGFAEEEGVALTLSRSPSWSTLRDKLCAGHLDAAHMLAPVPVAGALGMGGVSTPLHALSVLSVNGNIIGVSRSIGERMRAAGHDFAFTTSALPTLAPRGRRLSPPPGDRCGSACPSRSRCTRNWSIIG